MKWYIARRIGLLLCLQLSAVPGMSQTPEAPTPTPTPDRAQIMIVGAIHFVSKANIYNPEIDNPLSPKRQSEIEDIVQHLARFHPTKVVLEETSGTSDIEQHYLEYLKGTFTLPASENYQIGFRIAKSMGHARVYTINAFTNFPYDSVLDFAKTHHQTAVLDAEDALIKQFMQTAALLEKNGTFLDVLRYYNSDEAIRANNSAYMYLARVGDSTNFIGARLVSRWHLRNLEMFAKLTRLVESPNERILVLYGQGHAYLLRDFVRESPDFMLVDTEQYLR